MTPEPMNTVMGKESKESAIEKRGQRQTMIVQDVASMAPGIGCYKIIIIDIWKANRFIDFWN